MVDAEPTCRDSDRPAISASLLRLLVPVLFAAAVIVLRGPLIGAAPSLGDDGYLLNAVERISHGEVLYRDFQRNYAPGSFYAFALLFHWTGLSLAITRIVWLVCLWLTSWFSYRLVSRVAPAWAGLLAGLLPIILMPPVHKMFVPLTAAASLSLCAWLIESFPTRRRCAIVGLGLGALAAFRQDCPTYAGLIAVASIAGYAFSRTARRPLGAIASRVLSLAGGVLAVWVPIGLAFASAGAVPQMLRGVLLDGARDNRGMLMPFPALSEGITVLLYYLPAVSIAIALTSVGGALWLKKAGHKHALLAQWAAMALMMHLVYIYRADVAHVKQALVAPALILAWGAGVPWRKAWLPLLAGGCLAVAFYCGVAGKLQAHRTLSPDMEENQPSNLLAEIRTRTRPGEPIFVAPFSPMLYVLSGRPNATAYDAAFPGLVSTAEAQGEIIRDLERKHVRVVLIKNRPLDGQEDRRFLTYMPLVDSYLEERFALDARRLPWLIFTRRESH